MKILIIEDERRAAEDLEKMLQTMPQEIEVVGNLHSYAQAKRWLEDNLAPDLILSDIELGDGISFDLFRSIHFTVPVIFCTAYDQYAIAAFEANGIDYLLKPVEEQKLEAAMAKYEQLARHFSLNSPQYQGQLKQVIQQLDIQPKSSLLVHYQDKIIPIKTADMLFIYAVGGKVTLYTGSGKQYPLHQTLDSLEAILDKQVFFKVNRQYIVHKRAVERMEHFFTRRLQVILKVPSPEKIIVSKEKAPQFLRWMEL